MVQRTSSFFSTLALPGDSFAVWHEDWQVRWRGVPWFSELGLAGIGLGVEGLLGLLSPEVGLDLLELGGGYDRGVLMREDFCDFLLHVFQAFGERRIQAERLRDVLASGSLWQAAFQKMDETIRIVAGLIQVLEAEEVCGALCVAMEFEISQGNRQVLSVVRAVTRPASWSERYQGDGGELHELTFGRLHR